MNSGQEWGVRTKVVGENGEETSVNISEQPWYQFICSAEWRRWAEWLPASGLSDWACRWWYWGGGKHEYKKGKCGSEEGMSLGMFNLTHLWVPRGSASSWIYRSEMKRKGPYLLPDHSVLQHTASLQKDYTHQVALLATYTLSPLSLFLTTSHSIKPHSDDRNCPTNKCHGSLQLQASTFLYSTSKINLPYLLFC